MANNSGELTYNNVNVVGSTVRGYSKVGLLHGFTQNNGSFVAEVGGYQYETLPAAIAAAQDGETVKLLENITEANAIQIPQDADITLNLNGQVLMVTNGDALLNNGVLTILDSLTGGKIISENSGAIGVGSGSTTTIHLVLLNLWRVQYLPVNLLVQRLTLRAVLSVPLIMRLLQVTDRAGLVTPT